MDFPNYNFNKSVFAIFHFTKLIFPIPKIFIFHIVITMKWEKLSKYNRYYPKTAQPKTAQPKTAQLKTAQLKTANEN